MKNRILLLMGVCIVALTLKAYADVCPDTANVSQLTNKTKVRILEGFDLSSIPDAQKDLSTEYVNVNTFNNKYAIDFNHDEISSHRKTTPNVNFRFKIPEKNWDYQTTAGECFVSHLVPRMNNRYKILFQDSPKCPLVSMSAFSPLDGKDHPVVTINQLKSEIGNLITITPDCNVSSPKSSAEEHFFTPQN